MKYQLLLLDIDGTLTQPSGSALPSKRIVQAVEKAQQYVHIAVATGRSKESTLPVVEALGLSGYAICDGGGTIVDTSAKKIIFEQLLSVDQLKELVILALPFGYSLYTNQHQYNAALSSASEVTQPAAKLFIEAVKNKDVAAMLAELSSVASVVAHPTISWTKGEVMDIHVNHALATKRHGAEYLSALLDIQRAEIIAVGDGHNDVPLLEAAGLKVAMGNAPDEVKAIADYVAPSLADDGVAEVIERFILSD